MGKRLNTLSNANAVRELKYLGDEIGYGNLMCITSALWRKTLKDSGVPAVIAFVPTCTLFVKDEYKDLTNKGAEIYDDLIMQVSNS
jgi:Fe-S oxidoreductase